MTQLLSTATLVVVVVVASIAIGPVGTASASIPTGPAVPAIEITPKSLCEELESDGTAVTAATYAAPDTPLSGSRTYYGGTTLMVVFCKASDEPAPTDAWNLADHAGIAEVERQNRAYVVNLANQATSIGFAEQVEQKDPDQGFSVDVTVGAAVDSQLPDVEQIAFGSMSEADSYTGTEQDFLTAVEAVESNVTAVNESATEIRNQGITAAEPDVTLQSLETARTNLNNAADESELFLYRAAFDGPATTEALERTESLSRETNETAEAALDEYGLALDQRASVHRTAIRNSTLFGSGIGLIIGLFVGVLIPYRRKRKIDYDRKFTETAGGLRIFRVPAVLAVVALILGVLILWFSVPIQLVIP